VEVSDLEQQKNIDLNVKESKVEDNAGHSRECVEHQEEDGHNEGSKEPDHNRRQDAWMAGCPCEAAA
jgi:hypothetical protein